MTEVYLWCSRLTFGSPSCGWGTLSRRSSHLQTGSCGSAAALKASCDSVCLRGFPAKQRCGKKKFITSLNYLNMKYQVLFAESRSHFCCSGLVPWCSWRSPRRTSCSCLCPLPVQRTAPDISSQCSCGWPSGFYSAAAFLWRCLGAGPQSPPHHGQSLMGQK